MKIFFLTILSAVLLISLSACGNSTVGSAQKNHSPSETTSKTNSSGTSQPNTTNHTNNSNNTNSSSKNTTQSSNTNTNGSNENNASEESFYGTWQIKKVIAYAPVGTYSSNDIHSLTGKQLTFSKDIATCFGDEIKDINNSVSNPDYKKTVITKNELLSDYRVTLDQIGLTGDSVTEVKATDTKGHIIFFLTSDKNKLILYGGGTFFELEKVQEQTSSTSSDEENNRNKAVSLVKGYLRDKKELIEDKNHFVLFDGVINHYYIVRYSTLVSGHSSTNGRYAVDINKGKIVDVAANPDILDTSNGNTQSSKNDSTTNNGSSDKQGTSATDSDNQVADQPTGIWVKTFEKDLYKGYHVTPSRYKYLGNGYWEVWVKEVDTGQNPYVTVNQNTGDFHG